MTEQEFLTDFISFLNEQGMCITPQRRAIVQAFFSLPGHHTSEEFYQHVSKIDPRVGQTTVYRTLKLLCQAELASEIQFYDNLARYEIANPKKHHDHLICLNCGKVVEVYDPRIENIQAELAGAHGFDLKGHSHNLYGICPPCQEKLKTAQGDGQNAPAETEPTTQG